MGFMGFTNLQECLLLSLGGINFQSFNNANESLFLLPLLCSFINFKIQLEENLLALYKAH